MIQIKNLRNTKPSTAYDVVICRGKSPLGNPFYLDDVNDKVKRDEVCDKYEVRFNEQLAQYNAAVIAELQRLTTLYRQYGKLNLFCFCAPKRCHGETIRAYILKL
jgi:aminoglycoside phosphotransferase (APT) family kinase protein